MLRAIVVGAGFSGAVTARLLAEAGYQVELIEQRDTIAGNCYDYVDSNGVIVQAYGAHLFHTDSPAVMALLNRFAGFFPYRHTVLAETEGTLVPVPFNLRALDLLFSPAAAAELRAALLASYPYGARLPLGELRKNGNPSIRRLADFIQEKLYVPYTEKQWGRDCRDLPAFIIRRLPVRFTYDNNYFNDRYQGIPIGGYTAVVERMLEGIEVRTNTDYFAFKKENPDIAERVIFTGMIDEYFSYRLGALQYRSVRFETEVLDCDNYQGNAVVNYTEKEVPFTRIIEHKHFEFGTQEKTVISREYSSEWKVGMEPYYPVNDAKNSRLYEEYKKLAEAEGNVIFGGRLGNYQYYDMDKVVEAALQKVREIG